MGLHVRVERGRLFEVMTGRNDAPPATRNNRLRTEADKGNPTV